MRINLISQLVARLENLLRRRDPIRSNRRQRDRHCDAFEILEARLVLAATPLAPQSLLPDLTSWADQSKGFIYDWTVVGNDLRLTTAMANIGTGPLELRGGATQGTSQEVYQRIYASDGTFTNVLAGTFTYHPEHGHIHFDGFAQFRLRAVLSDGGVGAIVASGGKTSFCLLDVERYNTSGPSSPRFLSCGQIQGISVGWADVYDRGLPGQSIDITNVPDGNYWLETEVDPDNRLMESNEDNNVTRIQIALQRSGGGGTIPPDVFESNNSFASASILAPPEDHAYSNLSIHSSTDADYYRVTASAPGTMAFRLSFQHAQGDVDMEVFDSNQTRIGQANSTQDSEQFSFAAVAGQYYFVRVYGYSGATNPSYSFIVDQPAGTNGGVADPFEENDSFAAARSLSAIDQTYNGLNINATGDDDYYSVIPTASGTMTVSLAFLNSQGDIDLELLNAAQTRLAISDSTNDREQISLPVTAGQAVYIRAFGYRGATNPNYSLVIDVPNVSNVPIVRYLSMTGGGTLNSTDGTPSQNFSDADILKLTVQANGLYGYRLHFDASDVGLTTSGEDIDAFTFLPDGSIIVSTVSSFSVPGPNGTTIAGNGEDLLRFVPTSLGSTTAGTWSMYFDGSDVGLSGTEENIDALAVLADGRILVSTTGAFSVSGASGQDEDLLAFAPTSLGPTTVGSWSVYFDGSDVGLGTNSNEDINGLCVRETGGNPMLFFSTVGDFAAGGVSGANEDVFAFTLTTPGSNTAGTFAPGLTLDGSLYGLSAFNVDGIYFIPETSGAPALTQPTTTQGSLLAVANPAPTITSPPAAALRQIAQLSPSANVSSPAAATQLAIRLSGTAAANGPSRGLSPRNRIFRQAVNKPSVSFGKHSVSGIDLAILDHIALSLDDVLLPLRNRSNS